MFDRPPRAVYHSRAMLFYLFLLFTIVPIVELALLVWLGGQTAWWVPVVLVLSTGALGALLWRAQSWKALRRIQDDMAAGRIPTDTLVDGLMVFLAGAFLITPGMITDAIGFALLIPLARAAMKRLARTWFLRHVEVKTASFRTAYSTDNGTPPGHDRIIDAHVVNTRVEDAT